MGMATVSDIKSPLIEALPRQATNYLVYFVLIEVVLFNLTVSVI